MRNGGEHGHEEAAGCSPRLPKAAGVVELCSRREPPAAGGSVVMAVLRGEGVGAGDGGRMRKVRGCSEREELTRDSLEQGR